MEQHPSFRKPLILAVSLAILSSLVYWFEFSKKPAKEAETEQEKKLFALKDPSVRKVTLSRDGKTVSLECTSPKDQCKMTLNVQWTLTEPLKAKADSTSVQNLITSLLTMSSGDSVSLRDETPEARTSILKSYQLDASSRALPSAEKIQIVTDEGKTITAHVGAFLETLNASYAMAERDGKVIEDRIYLLPKSQLSATQQPVQHWRDKRMVTLTQGEISQFKLSTPEGELSGARGETWKVTQGKNTFPADLDAVSTFLSGVVFLNAKNFAAEKKDSTEGKTLLRGLKKEAELKLSNGSRSQTMTVYSKTFRDGNRSASIAYATLDDLDPVFEIDTNSLERMKRKISDLRLKKLLPVTQRGEIRWMRIKSNGKSIQAKLDGSWTRVGEGKPLITENVNSFLDRISSNVIDAFLPEQSPSGGAVLAVEMGPSEKEPLHEFQFWKKGNRIFAKDLKSTRRETHELNASLNSELPWTEESLINARIAPRPEPPPSGEEDHDGHGH